MLINIIPILVTLIGGWWLLIHRPKQQHLRSRRATAKRFEDDCRFLRRGHELLERGENPFID